MAETCKRIGKYCIIKHCFYYKSEKEPYFEKQQKKQRLNFALKKQKN